MRRILLALMFFMNCACLVMAQTPQKVMQQLQTLSDSSQGTLGVWALCPETGQRLGIREKMGFPMMSTYKVPIGLCFLSQVHAGKHKLDDTVHITPALYAPGHSPLARLAQGKMIVVTKEELLRRMVSESDNTACDVLLARIGGPAAVTKYLRTCGIKGMRVDRTERQLNAAALGVRKLPVKWSLPAFDSIVATLSDNERSQALREVMADKRDATSPEAMVELLKRLNERTLPAFSHYELILDMMINTPTGMKRIKGLLPAGTVVAHKTGTQYTIGGINGASNNVGIITTADGKRHILIAIYLKGSTLSDDGRDRVIARAAQVIYTALTH